jgi:REP element-mobilizing transposase RayT
MARPLRIEFPGAIYHVTSRGNAHQAIFEDDADRFEFFAVLTGAVERHGWLCHAYCLMDNHYHLMVETPDGNLARGMARLNGLYTQRFNRRHQRIGHLFQGRYKAILVERESYLLELCRYLVLNPVRAGLVRRAAAYRWSSYRATAGDEPAPRFLTTDWVLSQFATRRRPARERYAAFVAEGAARPSPWPALQGQALLGGAGFVRSLRPHLEEAAGLSEVPRAQRDLGRPDLVRALDAKAGGAKAGLAKAERNRRIAEAHLRHGYTLTEIGRYLGLHYTTVSRIVTAAESNPETL